MHGRELTAPCVLIISDTESHCAALRRQVEPLGVQLFELASCQAAIEQAKHCDVALMLLDLQMPMLDGIEAVRQLRTAPRTAYVPVIMIAEGRIGLSERQRGRALGSVSFLQRQELDFDALGEHIQLLLQQHVRANALQVQIEHFLDEQSRLATENPLMRAVQPSLHRHLLLDLLTGLPNQMYFELNLLNMIRRGARNGQGLALVWIDLDHLNRVNQRYGRQTGDQMLIEIAQRLETVVRGSDVLARIEGDTYGLILDGVSKPKVAENALAKLLAVAGQPLELAVTEGPVTVIPTLSVGVAFYPSHSEDMHGLLVAAQQAAQEALDAGGDGVRVAWDGSGKAAPRPAKS